MPRTNIHGADSGGVAVEVLTQVHRLLLERQGQEREFCFRQKELLPHLAISQPQLSRAIACLRRDGRLVKHPDGTWTAYPEPDRLRAARSLRQRRPTSSELLRQIRAELRYLRSRSHSAEELLRQIRSEGHLETGAAPRPHARRSRGRMAEAEPQVRETLPAALPPEPQSQMPPAAEAVTPEPQGVPQPSEPQPIPEERWPWPDSPGVRPAFVADRTTGVIYLPGQGMGAQAGVDDLPLAYLPVIAGFRPAPASLGGGSDPRQFLDEGAGRIIYAAALCREVERIIAATAAQYVPGLLRRISS